MTSHILDIVLPESRRSASGEPSWREYKIIPFPSDARSFFPGYKEHFIFQTDIGDVEAWVTAAARSGTLIGNSDEGRYIGNPRKSQRRNADIASLGDWYDAHSELEPGDVLRIIRRSPTVYQLYTRITRW